jgi:hypothetical protein
MASMTAAEQKRRLRVAKDIHVAAAHLELFYGEPELAETLRGVADDISSGRKKSTPPESGGRA